MKNAKNIKKRADNRSGIKGVCQESRTGKWLAYITVNGKTKRLGKFTTKELAAQARWNAEKDFFPEETH